APRAIVGPGAGQEVLVDAHPLHVLRLVPPGAQRLGAAPLGRRLVELVPLRLCDRPAALHLLLQEPQHDVQLDGVRAAAHFELDEGVGRPRRRRQREELALPVVVAEDGVHASPPTTRCWNHFTNWSACAPVSLPLNLALNSATSSAVMGVPRSPISIPSRT